MAVLDHTSTLESIREKVAAGERLDFEDGLALFESDDLLALGELAEGARRVRGGTDDVFFVQNLYLNQTNVCRVKCKFCAFAATRRQEHAYTLSAAELVEDALRQRELTEFTEIHMVNGENPHVDFSFYVDTVRSLHEAMPGVHLKLYTASEIHHMTRLSGLTHEEVLRELASAGLGSLPGGGAEIFAERVRKLVAPGKEHPDFWFHTNETAHRLGIPTHCTMLYGHVETYEERVDHLLRLREQQDRTRGFLAFIPLAFHPENTVFERRGWRHTTGPRRSRRSSSSSASCRRPAGCPCSATRSTTSCAGGSDPARPHLVRQHGACLLSARARCRGGHRRPHRAEPLATRR